MELSKEFVKAMDEISGVKKALEFAGVAEEAKKLEIALQRLNEVAAFYKL